VLEQDQPHAALDALRDLMERTLTRVILSALILISLLPLPFVHELRLIFFAIFASEVTLRAILLFAPSAPGQRRRPRAVEALFLVLDVIATLSFLDWSGIWDARYLRLFRLSRLVLLAGYWRGFLSDLWAITSQRERRYQFGFVAGVVLITTVSAAVLLHVAVDTPHDFDGDGYLYAWEQTGEEPPPEGEAVARDPEDADFTTQLWWAFRQVEDPGNLVEDARNLPLLAVSFTLTIGGLLVFSFLIGVGTTVVEELVVLSRQRRLGIRGHVVVVGGGQHAHFLLEELSAFRTKKVLKPKVVMFGSSSERPAALRDGELLSVQYRYGDPSQPEHLVRADVDRAALVIVLADEAGGDAVTVSRILAVRQVNPECRIVADVQRSQNERSVLEAGGDNTAAVTTRRFVGLFLAAELLFPGLDALFRELLTSLGQELYLAPWPKGSGSIERFDSLVARSVDERGVVPLGLRRGDRYDLNPPPGTVQEGVTGLLVLARSAVVARDFVADVAAGRFAGPPGAEPIEPPPYELSGELRRLRRLLVCGYREEIGDLFAELGQFLDGLEVRLMVASGRALPACEDLVGRLPHESGAHWVGRGDNCVALEREGEVRVVVRAFEGDPAADRSLLSVPEAEHSLEETDAVLFVADGSWGTDRDAKSALGVLKLLGLLREDPDRLRPGMRVVGEVQEAGKGDLLEHRLRALRRSLATNGEITDRSAILSTEKLRHYLLGQEVLVPGVAKLYEELLRETGDEVVKLVPPGERCFPAGPEISFPELAGSLARRRLILLAVEIAGPDGSQACVNPAPGAPGHRVKPEELTGLFCLGDVDRLMAKS
jgi:voltage-gated potassium channel Kch